MGFIYNPKAKPNQPHAKIMHDKHQVPCKTWVYRTFHACTGVQRLLLYHTRKYTLDLPYKHACG